MHYLQSVLTLRMLITACVAVSAASLAASCSSGQITQTSSQVAAIPGVDAQLGPIAIRNAQILPAPERQWDEESTVPISIVLVNQGDVADSLVEVSSNIAEAFNVHSGPTESLEQMPPTQEPQEPSPTASPTATGSPTISPTPTTSPTGGEPAPPTPTATSPSPSPTSDPDEPVSDADGSDSASEQTQAPDAEASASVDLPAGELANLTGSGQDPRFISLDGIAEPIASAQEVTVTFTFANAGSITLNLPVGPPSEPRPRHTPSQEEGTTREH